VSKLGYNRPPKATSSEACSESSIFQGRTPASVLRSMIFHLCLTFSLDDKIVSENENDTRICAIGTKMIEIESWYVASMTFLLLR
jgi:hypothetical protein